ncbi:hypothetical protein B0H10DRAFT_1944022 [Mycena sp. CBHHK59/15]|nr:hypothetical protein B0H10DRAFT_1944022 [Mycena sp. CBHHK59/15]
MTTIAVTMEDFEQPRVGGPRARENASYVCGHEMEALIGLLWTMINGLRPLEELIEDRTRLFAELETDILFRLALWSKPLFDEVCAFLHSRTTLIYKEPPRGAALLSRNSAEYLHHFPVELQTEIFSYMDLSTLRALGRTCCYYRVDVADKVHDHMRKMMRLFGLDWDIVRLVLFCTGTIGSGSVGLLSLFVSFKKVLLFEPNDLDLYTTRHKAARLIRFLALHADYFVAQYRRTSEYLKNRCIYQILRLRRDGHQLSINIIISTSNDARMPIFMFDNTMLMNWFDSDMVYSAYPDMTFRFVGLLNTSVIRLNTPEAVVDLFERMRKYEERGFRIEDTAEAADGHHCSIAPLCPLTIRSTLDPHGFMWKFEGPAYGSVVRTGIQSPPAAVSCALGGLACEGSGLARVTGFVRKAFVKVVHLREAMERPPTYHMEEREHYHCSAGGEGTFRHRGSSSSRYVRCQSPQQSRDPNIGAGGFGRAGTRGGIVGGGVIGEFRGGAEFEVHNDRVAAVTDVTGYKAFLTLATTSISIMLHSPAQELPSDRMGCVEDVLNALRRIIIGGKAADICVMERTVLFSMMSVQLLCALCEDGPSQVAALAMSELGFRRDTYLPRFNRRGPTFEKFTPADLANEILLGFNVEGVMFFRNSQADGKKRDLFQEQNERICCVKFITKWTVQRQWDGAAVCRVDRAYEEDLTMLQYRSSGLRLLKDTVTIRLVSRHCSWNRVRLTDCEDREDLHVPPDWRENKDDEIKAWIPGTLQCLTQYRKRLEIAKEQMLAAEVELEIAESLVQQQQARVGACQQLPADICHEIFSDVLAAVRQDRPWLLNVSVFLAQVCARWRGMFQTTAMATLLNPILLLRAGFEMEGVVKKGLRSAEAIDARLSYFEGTKTSVDMVIALDDGLPVSALKRVLRSKGSWRRLSITGLHAIGLKERGLRHVLCTSEPSFGELKELFLNSGIPDWRDTADKLPWWAAATENLRLLPDDLGLHDYKNLEHVWLRNMLQPEDMLGLLWAQLKRYLMNDVKPVALSSAGDTAGEAEAIRPQEWAGSNGMVIFRRLEKLDYDLPPVTHLTNDPFESIHCPLLTELRVGGGERWREPTQPSAGVVCPRAALKAFIARSGKELERLDLQTRMELDDNAIMELVRPCHYLRTLQFRHRSENILTPTLLEYLADTRNLHELQEVVIPDPGPGEDYSLEEWITGFTKMGLARFGPGGIKVVDLRSGNQGKEDEKLVRIGPEAWGNAVVDSWDGWTRTALSFEVGPLHLLEDSQHDFKETIVSLAKAISCEHNKYPGSVQDIA